MKLLNWASAGITWGSMRTIPALRGRIHGNSRSNGLGRKTKNQRFSAAENLRSTLNTIHFGGDPIGCRKGWVCAAPLAQNKHQALALARSGDRAIQFSERRSERLVAATTITPLLPSKPSISVRIWFLRPWAFHPGPYSERINQSNQNRFTTKGW